ncbi:hypothetical protein FOZ76_06490 [Verticiella sediminum]|uniref:Uncharacterized protein n=1 Tax=Verticiella sediminum TaxID=1247510 RepID=A0A556AWR0_9BURK|nr:hypothetical protein FOZ76_06490 [Verticiella sediminum]
MTLPAIPVTSRVNGQALRIHPASGGASGPPPYFQHMRHLGFQLLLGDFLARSVRGRPCAPPN